MPTLSTLIPNNVTTSSAIKVIDGLQSDSRIATGNIKKHTIYDGSDSVLQSDSKTAKLNTNIRRVIYDGSNSVRQSDSKSSGTAQPIDINSIEKMLRLQGIYTDTMNDKYQMFKRYPVIDISNDILQGTKEYIFITKPELNIYTDARGTILNDQFKIQPIFLDINERHPQILKQLQYNLSIHQSPFINILSYTVLNTADVPDLNAKELYTAQNIYGTKINYRGSSIGSDQDVSFTLEFRENNTAEIYTLFKLWDVYENLKFVGIVSPPSPEYTQKRILHDKVGAFKFIVDEIGNIIFWCQWWGVIPDGASRGSWSEVHENQSHSVNFKADFVDDMDPQTLVDFNTLVQPYRDKCKYDESSGWNSKYGVQNNELQVIPFIKRVENNYKLAFQGGSL